MRGLSGTGRGSDRDCPALFELLVVVVVAVVVIFFWGRQSTSCAVAASQRRRRGGFRGMLLAAAPHYLLRSCSPALALQPQLCSSVQARTCVTATPSPHLSLQARASW